MYLHSNENLRALAQRVFGYSGRKFQVHPAETEEIRSYWDGGSRTYFASINLITGECQKYGDVGGLFGPASIHVEITPEVAVMKHCIFCGKDFGIEFLVHPSHFPKYLPEGTSELSRNEMIVLIATRSYKSSYAGVSNYRFVEARQETGIAQTEWDDAKSLLIEKKFLNKAGALTVEGRNAAGDWSKNLRAYRK